MTPHETGQRRIREILGPVSDKIIQNFTAISPDFANYIVDLAYGEFYARPGMSDMHREIAAVSCLIGQGQLDLPLKSHLQGMLNVGHTQKDIIELLLFLIPYVGFPSIVGAMKTAQGVFEEMKRAA